MSANFVEQTGLRRGIASRCYRRGFGVISHIGTLSLDSAPDCPSGACAAGAVWCAIQRKRADMTYHPESAAITPRSNTTPQPRLFDEVRRHLRLKHYSLSTERIYLQWMRRFILASGKRHPREMGGAESAAPTFFCRGDMRAPAGAPT